MKVGLYYDQSWMNIFGANSEAVIDSIMAFVQQIYQ